MRTDGILADDERLWLNGYSDHLPTTIYLVKEVK